MPDGKIASLAQPKHGLVALHREKQLLGQLPADVLRAERVAEATEPVSKSEKLGVRFRKEAKCSSRRA